MSCLCVLCMSCVVVGVAVVVCGVSVPNTLHACVVFGMCVWCVLCQTGVECVVSIWVCERMRDPGGAVWCVVCVLVLVCGVVQCRVGADDNMVVGGGMCGECVYVRAAM